MKQSITYCRWQVLIPVLVLSLTASGPVRASDARGEPAVERAQLARSAAKLNERTSQEALCRFLGDAHKQCCHEFECNVVERLSITEAPIEVMIQTLDCMKSQKREELAMKLVVPACRLALRLPTNSDRNKLLASMAVNTMARNWEKLKDPLPALKLIERLDPDLARVYFYQGIHLRDKGKKAEALKLLMKAQELQPTDADHWLACLDCIMRGQSPTSLSPSQLHESLALLRSVMYKASFNSRHAGNCAARLKNFSRADIERVTDTIGLNADAQRLCLLTKACTYALRRDWPRAEAAAQQFLKQAPCNALGSLILAAALGEQKKSLKNISRKLLFDDQADVLRFAVTLDSAAAKLLLLTCGLDQSQQDSAVSRLLALAPPGQPPAYLALQDLLASDDALQHIRSLFEDAEKSIDVGNVHLLLPTIVAAAVDAYNLNKQQHSRNSESLLSYFELLLLRATDCSKNSGNSSAHLAKLLETFQGFNKVTRLTPAVYRRWAIVQACDYDLPNATKILTECLKYYDDPRALQLRAAMLKRQGEDELCARDVKALAGRLPCTEEDLRMARRQWENSMAWERLLFLWRISETSNSSRATAVNRHLCSERRYYANRAKLATDPAARYQALLAAAELSLACKEYAAATEYVNSAESIYNNFSNTRELRGMIYEALGKRSEAKAERSRVIAAPRAPLAVE